MPDVGQNQPGADQQPLRSLLDEPIIRSRRLAAGIGTEDHGLTGDRGRDEDRGHSGRAPSEHSRGEHGRAGRRTVRAEGVGQAGQRWSSFASWGSDDAGAGQPGAGEDELPDGPVQQVPHASTPFATPTVPRRDPADAQWAAEVSQRLDEDGWAEDETAGRVEFDSAQVAVRAGRDMVWADGADSYTAYTAFDDNNDDVSGGDGYGTDGYGTDGYGTDGHGTDDGYGDPSGSAVNWALVNVLREATAEELRQRTEQVQDEARFAGRRFSDADRRELTRSVCVEAVYSQKRRDDRSGERSGGREWTTEGLEMHVQALLDSFIGFGRLQPLFEIATAEDITVHGPSVVVKHTDGRIEKLGPVSDSDDDLERQVAYILEHASPPRKLNSANPWATVMLGRRYRLSAINRQISVHPTVAIRRHNLMQVSLAGLVARQVMPLRVAQFLDAAVRSKMSIVVSGPQGAGKTTLLRALIDAIPTYERIATVETDLELFSHLPAERANNIALFERVAMGESISDKGGDISVNDIIPATLRQMISRLVVGEVRGGEGNAMMQAMAAGAGSLSSIHSDNIAGTISRLANRIVVGGEYPYASALTAIGQHINLIVHVEEIHDGDLRLRLVTDIREVKPAAENGFPTVGHVYEVDPGSGYRDGNLHVSGELEARLRRHRRQLPTAKRRGER